MRRKARVGKSSQMELRSPSVGKVLRLSMKVEIPINAGANGRVTELRVAPGDQIQRNAVLAVLQA